MPFDVFISYPHQEKATADAACAKLEAEGIRCWIAPRDFTPSAEWVEAIVDAIDQCRVMVLIFSAHANRSKQVSRELQQAFEGEKPVVPFRIENVTPERSLRYYMGPVHWLDALTPPLEQHLQKLAASVLALVRGSEAERSAEDRIKVETAQEDNHPVVCVNWDDAEAYTLWLAEATGRSYRLLTEAEWEYSARAGTTTPFWWGATITSKQANYDCRHQYKYMDECEDSRGFLAFRGTTAPVGSFEANRWGLYNVHGNVNEWCQDMWHHTYSSAPSDGSAWLHGGDEGKRVYRGGSWATSVIFVRAANRLSRSIVERWPEMGFRVARTLTPLKSVVGH